MPRRYVLIGSGPGSMAAAEAVRTGDRGAEIAVIAAEPEEYYSRPGLAYYLAKEEPEASLFPFTPKDLGALGITMVHGRASRIDRAGHVVTLDDGRQLPYDRLLVATGSLAVPIGVPGADLDGVVKLDDMRDARDLINRAHRAKAAVVVGGGITALEIVEGLCSHRVKVHYFMRKDRYWSNVLSESESDLVHDGLRARGVQIHEFTETARIHGREGHVADIETTKGTRVACDLVAVAIGVLPQKRLAEEAGIECGRGVLVDQYLRSSDPDVFAAGDVAEVYDAPTGRRSLDILWNSAVAKGRVAGHNMATEPMRTYDGGAPLNVTRLAGFKLTIMGTVGNGTDADVEGIVRGDSESWRHLGPATMVESQVGDAHVRLALGENAIAGAVVMGEQSLSFALQELVKARADISGIREQLVVPGATVAPLIDSLWREWKAGSVQTAQ